LAALADYFDADAGGWGHVGAGTFAPRDPSATMGEGYLLAGAEAVNNSDTAGRCFGIVECAGVGAVIGTVVGGVLGSLAGGLFTGGIGFGPGFLAGAGIARPPAPLSVSSWVVYKILSQSSSLERVPWDALGRSHSSSDWSTGTTEVGGSDHVPSRDLRPHAGRRRRPNVPRKRSLRTNRLSRLTPRGDVGTVVYRVDAEGNLGLRPKYKAL
jgi:hypothetical protein